MSIKWILVLVLGLLTALGGVMWLSRGSGTVNLREWISQATTTRQEADQLRQELQQSQDAIRTMSQRIQQLTAEATRAKRDALAAAARAELLSRQLADVKASPPPRIRLEDRGY